MYNPFGVVFSCFIYCFVNLFNDELRPSGVGCYIFHMFIGCIMYADDIILLSGSLNDLQSMFTVCDNVSSQLMLKFTTNKCKSIAFGKTTNRALSGDGLRLDNGVITWSDTIQYFGIHFRCGKRLQFDTGPYCHGAINLNKGQLCDLNVCWNNLNRKLFHCHRWECVPVFINGIGKLDFLHLSKFITAKFSQHLSI